MTVASELLWELVPPLVLAADDFVLAALLEPCYDMGGDAFDYALNDGVLHLAVFDGMGHGLAAAGVTAFALSAYRHSRRQRGPAASYAAVDRALFAEYPSIRFVTALIAELELSSGRLRWVSAGHPAPLLLRDGRLIKELDLTPAPPLGTGLAATAPAEGQESLEPGDMILLYTDGLSEARRPDGELFTVERLGEFIERQAAGGQPAPETLRRLRAAIIDRGEGSLRDDATALLVEWRRGSERRCYPKPSEPLERSGGDVNDALRSRATAARFGFRAVSVRPVSRVRRARWDAELSEEVCPTTRSSGRSPRGSRSQEVMPSNPPGVRARRSRAAAGG